MRQGGLGDRIRIYCQPNFDRDLRCRHYDWHQFERHIQHRRVEPVAASLPSSATNPPGPDLMVGLAIFEALETPKQRWSGLSASCRGVRSGLARLGNPYCAVAPKMSQFCEPIEAPYTVSNVVLSASHCSVRCYGLASSRLGGPTRGAGHCRLSRLSRSQFLRTAPVRWLSPADRTGVVDML
jgi:hypothetical protein